MSDARRMPLERALLGACLAASALISGCTVVTVASTAVSAGATVVGAGVSAGTAVVKGTVKATKAVANAVTDDNKD